eukprot:NODE_2907_length_449_cov_189.627500_g2306_i0.p1 GENE.NODE_2907_length_449_cov_189.627500_g2306_i0~~NODE_2907_length_449_cov_189.627500_g2306_i0.p1  ORF type:complete len:86 (+),score=18.04 NODE_2907_length_449_cov_189.627500_g2306_i0:31-288(+)
MGYNYSDSQLTRLMYDVDTDGSGVIEFDEFLLLSEKMTMVFSKETRVIQIARHKIEADEEEEALQGLEDHNQARVELRSTFSPEV